MEAPIVKQWKCISAHMVRLVNVDLNKRIFRWCNDKSSRSRQRTGYTGQRFNLMKLDCLNFAIFQILSRSHFRIAFQTK